jgi:hypothetical protein
MFIDRDLDGWYEQCLLCAYRGELKNLAEFKEEEKKPAAPPPPDYDM